MWHYEDRLDIHPVEDKVLKTMIGWELKADLVEQFLERD